MNLGNSSTDEIDHLTDTEKAERRTEETSRQELEILLVSGNAQSSLAGRWERFHCRDFRKLRRVELLYDAKSQNPELGFQLSPRIGIWVTRDNDLYVRNISNPQSVDGEMNNCGWG